MRDFARKRRSDIFEGTAARSAKRRGVVGKIARFVGKVRKQVDGVLQGPTYPIASCAPPATSARPPSI
eukprot:3457013-Lingulodinium_polyedra.AAC.1